MKAFLVLLKLTLLNLLGGLRFGLFRKDNGKINLSRICLYVMVGVSFLILGGMVIFLEVTLYGAMAALKMRNLLLGLAVLLSMVTTLLFGVAHTLASLYFNRDSVSLAHLPVSSRTVLCAKWTEIYLPEVALSAVFLLPLCILYGAEMGLGAAYYIRMAVLVLTMPLYPLSIALLLSSVMGRFTAFMRHKEAWVVVATIAMVVLVLGVEFTLLPQIPEDANAMFFVNLLLNNRALMDFIIGAFPPALWAVNGLTGQWGQFGLFFAVGMATMALALYLAGGKYLATCIKHTEQGVVRRKRTAKAADTDYTPRSALRAVFAREMNEALKTPVYMLNGVIGAMMMPMILAGSLVGVATSVEMEVLMAKKDELLAMVSPFDLTLVMAALFAFNCWITPLISTAVSREGKRLQVTRMIPVSAATILNAKILVNIAITAVSSLVVALALGVVLGTEYILCVVMAFVMLLMLSYATSVLNLWVDVIRPMLDWKNETHVMKQNMNQVIGMALSTLLIALTVIPVILLFKAGAAWRLTAAVTALAVECGLALLMMKRVLPKKYAAIEP